MMNSTKQKQVKITYKEGVHIMKKTIRFLALALSAVLAAGSIAPVTVQAASNTISRIGNKERSVYVGGELELSVKKNGSFSDNKIHWTISDTSILKYDDDDRYDDDIELRAVKKGTTKVTAKNLNTGGKIVYTVTVKKSSNTISRIGEAKRSVTAGKEFELAVKKNGSFSDNEIHWTIADTSIVKFDDDDRYDNDIDLKAVKAGTTKVTAKNLLTGGKLVYTITVKKASGSNLISRVGNASRTVEVDEDIELRVTKGSGLANSDIEWSIEDTSILRFEDGDNVGPEVELEARKTGTTKVTAKNLKTGGKLVYTIKVVPEYDD